MKSKMLFVLGAALLVVLTWTVLAQVQSPDAAKDPVCGMTVIKSTAKYTYDYKGTTYYFCSEGCKTSFAKEPEKFLSQPQTAETKPGMMGRGMGMGMGQGGGMMPGQQDSQLSKDIALDPVCGMVVKKSTAKSTYDYKGMTYYFCSEGCKTSFAKEPEKYLAKPAESKPGMMGQAMGIMHAQGEACPFMLPDVEKKFENTKTGVIITLSSKNPETAKKIQDHAAAMKDGRCPLMGKAGAGKKGEAGCPMGANCPMKRK